MATAGDCNAIAIDEACQRLVPPVLLASPSGWRYVYDGEDPALVAVKGAAIRQWVMKDAPRELRRLQGILDALVSAPGARHGGDKASPGKPRSSTLLGQPQDKAEDCLTVETKARIVITAARFVCPRRRQRQVCYRLEKWSAAERDVWTSPENERLAQGILQHPLLAKEGHSQIDRSLACSVDAEIAVFLLGEYIRPLFRTTQSNNVSSSTGRAKNPTANLVDQSARRGAPLDDEVIWKGGDLRTARNVRVLGSAIVTGLVETHDVSDSNKRDLSEAIAERHAGLGCAGVLYVCLSSIRDAVRRSVTSRAASDATNDDLWAEHWPLLLPPLLQLLEDPAPRYRLMGTAILGKTVLGAADPHAGSNCIDDDAQAHLRMRMSSLLLRTGVASLLARTLDANVTQISHGLAAALFQATSEAWLQLTSLTSADMARHDGRHGQYRAILANVKDDGGKARYERLSELIDAGILRTWAYAPSSARVEDILDPDGAESEADTGGGSVETEDDARGLDYGWEVCKESYEADNLLDVTFEALARLAGPGFLGVGIVRYLDACLEFLLQHLTAGLESKVSRWRQRETEQHKQRGAAQTASVGGMTAPLPSLSRECCAANAVLALVNAARLCPGLKAWTAQCLIAAAKCWTLLDDVDSEADAATTDDGHSDGPAQLRQLLTSIVAVLALAQPGLFAAVVKRLEAIERGRFRALFGAGSSALHLEKETDGTAV